MTFRISELSHHHHYMMMIIVIIITAIRLTWQKHYKTTLQYMG